MKKFLIIVFMSFMTISIFGQSDEILDVLYEKEDAQTLYTALLVLQASGTMSEVSTIEDTKVYLSELDWGVTILNDGEYITAGSFSLLVMKSFDIPHGVMYGFLPIKRYALKEMVYQKYLLGSPYPNDVMTSFDVIYAVSSLPVDESINQSYKE